MDTLKNVWLQNTALLLLVAGLAYAYWVAPPAVAHAAGGGWETGGYIALSMDYTHRLVLVDTSKQSICMYRCPSPAQFRLVSARSFEYDVRLKESGKWVEQSPRSFLDVRNEVKRLQKRSGG